MKFDLTAPYFPILLITPLLISNCLINYYIHLLNWKLVTRDANDYVYSLNHISLLSHPLWCPIILM